MSQSPEGGIGMPCGHDCIFIRDESIVVIVILSGGERCVYRISWMFWGVVCQRFLPHARTRSTVLWGCLLPGRSIHLCPPRRLDSSARARRRSQPYIAVTAALQIHLTLRLSRQQQVSRLSATVPRARHAQMPLGERCMCLLRSSSSCATAPTTVKDAAPLLPRFRRCRRRPVRPPPGRHGRTRGA